MCVDNCAGTCHTRDMNKTPAQTLSPSNADKIRNAETMFGTGSKQHLAAIKRFNGKK